MPQYTFFCGACALQFKRRLSMDEHASHKCPSCADLAKRQWDGQGFGFDFATTAGTAKANSGVAKHDYPTADNIVGRTSEDRWAVMRARNKAKSQIRDKGVALARRDFESDGVAISEYTTLGQPQFNARKQLEGKFKKKADQDGIEAPSKRMP